MPTSYDIEASVISKNAAVKSKGWELNTGIICPAGSFNGATDHFSFELYVPGSINHPQGTSILTTGDATLRDYFGTTALATTVTLLPGRYSGSFSLTRSTEIPATDPDDPGSWDACFVGVLMEPIGGPDDFNFGGAGGSPTPLPYPWPCFQNLNGDPTASDPFGLPTHLRTWTNYSGPEFNIATWPDSAGYEWVSGELPHPSSRFRYRCPFRIWVWQ